jgi:hypothetical protein
LDEQIAEAFNAITFIEERLFSLVKAVRKRNPHQLTDIHINLESDSLKDVFIDEKWNLIFACG